MKQISKSESDAMVVHRRTLNFFVIIVFCLAPFSLLPGPSYLYVMRLDFPHKTKGFALNGFYKGQPLEFKESCVVIREQQDCCAFTLVVTPEVRFKAEGNNVYYLERLGHKPFSWYDLTLRVDAKSAKTGAQYKWLIEKRKPQDVPLRLPEHTIVLYLDPELVDKLDTGHNLEQDEIAATIVRGLGAVTVIDLPAVVLKKDVKQEELHKAQAHSLLASLDLRPIHQEVAQEMKKQETVILSMVTGR